MFLLTGYASIILLSASTFLLTALKYHWHMRYNSFCTNKPTILAKVQTLQNSTWKPIFKRSSYIGLVWKSQWKL